MHYLITAILSIGCSLAAFAQDSTATKPASAKLLPVLWHQYAAEYRAMCHQAFNMARMRIDDTRVRRRKKYAIITDVDETVLDNSYYEAGRIRTNTEFEQSSWRKWTASATATPVPGAVDLLQYARKKGIRIFYISNRDTSEAAATVVNLKKFGFPDAEKEHMLFMAGTSSKETRRQNVMKDYQIVFMLGDNLNDFASVFEKKSSEDRNAETDKIKGEWGKKFIVLPNAIYGEWENALYDYLRRLSPEQREKMLMEKLMTEPRVGQK